MPVQSGPARETSPFVLFEEFEAIRPGVVRKRNFRYDLNALADFEQEIGMGFAQLMQMKATFATARAIVWAGLKWEDRGLSLDYVGDLLGRLLKVGKYGVNDFVMIAMKACAEQGALGPVASKAGSVPEGPAADADPNELVGSLVQPPQTGSDDAPGPDGSNSLNPSPTEP